jgi:hypothetical protein
MAFTDNQLATAMSERLVTVNIMTADERTVLLEDPTENNVREKLIGPQLKNFQAYWDLLGVWMGENGGDITLTSGTNVPGRVSGNPVGIGLKAIYNDAFRDVNQHILTLGFLPVKAVSNQLRLISVFNDDA